MPLVLRSPMNVAGSLTLVATGVFVAAAAAFAAPPHRAPGDANLTIGLIVKDTQVPFWLEMRKQAMAEAKAKHVALIFAAGRYAGDNTTQVNAIRT